jgi:hypothetical protein
MMGKAICIGAARRRRRGVGVRRTACNKDREAPELSGEIGAGDDCAPVCWTSDFSFRPKLSIWLIDRVIAGVPQVLRPVFWT